VQEVCGSGEKTFSEETVTIEKVAMTENTVSNVYLGTFFKCAVGPRDWVLEILEKNPPALDTDRLGHVSCSG
jgi:hypothetical protein